MKKVYYYWLLGGILILGSFTDGQSLFPSYIYILAGIGLIVYPYLIKNPNKKENRVNLNWKKGLLIATIIFLALLISKIYFSNLYKKDIKDKRTEFNYSSEESENHDSTHIKTESIEQEIDSLLN